MNGKVLYNPKGKAGEYAALLQICLLDVPTCVNIAIARKESLQKRWGNPRRN